MSDSVWPHGLQPTRLLCPWDSPGKNTGVGCHFLLQCMKVKEVTQSCLTLSDPHGLQPTRLFHPWDFPGNSTGVGCHCLLPGRWGTVIWHLPVVSCSRSALAFDMRSPAFQGFPQPISVPLLWSVMGLRLPREKLALIHHYLDQRLVMSIHYEPPLRTKFPSFQRVLSGYTATWWILLIHLSSSFLFKGISLSEWGTHVYLWRIHFDIWQNQYNIVKFKNKK